jgi:hypothetical protein
LNSINDKIDKLGERECSIVELTLKSDLERAEEEYDTAVLLENQYKANYNKWRDEETQYNKAKAIENDRKYVKKEQTEHDKTILDAQLLHMKTLKQEKETNREKLKHNLRQIEHIEHTKHKNNNAKDIFETNAKKEYPNYYIYNATTMPNKLIRVQYLDKDANVIHTLELMKLSKFKKDFPFRNGEPDEYLSEDD